MSLEAILTLMPKDIYSNIFHQVVYNNGKLKAGETPIIRRMRLVILLLFHNIEPCTDVDG